MFNKNILLSAAGATKVEKTPFTLYAWGDNNFGKIGDGTSTTSYLNNINSTSSPAQVGSLSNWAAVYGGDASSYAIKTDGTLWAWGSNVSGVLGVGLGGQYPAFYSPMQVGSLTNWQSLATTSGNSGDTLDDAGSYYVLAIKTDGTLWAWGRNLVGQLGTGDLISRSSPVQVGLDTNWSKVSISSNKDIITDAGASSFGASSLAIKSTGTLWAWGSNLDGQLGFQDVVFRSSPVQVGTLTNWSQVSVGSGVLAIKTDGTLWAWGNNNFGQLGTNNRIWRSSPVQVGALTNWKTVITNLSTTIAIKTDGTLWAWGSNTNGVLGIGLQGGSVSSPVQVGTLTNWDKVYFVNDYLTSFGQQSTVIAVKTDGTLWAWGYNYLGQLGISSTSNRSSPVQIGTASDWLNASGGSRHVLAVKTDGTLWTWGENYDGQLGYETNFIITIMNSRSSPVQIGNALAWADVSTESTHSLAIKTGGTLWAWGYNGNGQLGVGAFNISISSPVQVGLDTNWNAAVAGYNFSLATRTDGTLWAWGDNSRGGLGSGDTISRSSPVQVGALTDWKYVTAGYYYVLAIKTDGTLWAWGRNLVGQLGTGDLISRSSPVQVGTLTNWSSLSGGNNCVASIKTDGTLWTWGDNPRGELGSGDTISRSSPVQVGALTSWKSVSVGRNDVILSDHVLALRSNGTLWAWGNNTYGQLGLINTISRSSPVQVGNGTNWAAIAAGSDYSLAVKTDGTLWAWGNNSNGQLGTGDLISRSSPVQVGTLTNWIVNSAGTTSFGGTS